MWGLGCRQGKSALASPSLMKSTGLGELLLLPHGKRRYLGAPRTASSVPQPCLPHPVKETA